MATPVVITRVTSINTSLFENFLRGLEGEEAVTGFRGSGVPLDSDSFWLLLAQYDEQPVGYASVVLIPKADARRGFLFLDELIVLPGFRQRGVATALLMHVEQMARDSGLAGVRLLVRSENKGAQVLYQRMGFALNKTIFGQKRN